MKPYACYPPVRNRFNSPFTGYAPNPYRTAPATPAEARTTHPAANILRSETGFQIQLAIPGIPKENVKVEVIEDQLIISSTNPNQESKSQYLRFEFDYSNFKRNFRLPKNIDTANLNATFDQGMLNIDLPLKKIETRNIEIQ